eukprot:gene16680-16860_t
MKGLAELTEREVLALAIANEEEDSRIYQMFAEELMESYPHSAALFTDMAAEERGHRTMLFDMYSKKFGENLPPIRREDVKGFPKRRPFWLTKNLGLERMRSEASLMEYQAAHFYDKAAAQSHDVSVRKLFNDLADIERGHETKANLLTEELKAGDANDEEAATARRAFVLRYIQPGLAGLMDGSVSTLAPIFAAAFATHNNWDTFLVGLAASIGAGISMAFAEALSDDGSMTGRGAPWMRGFITGLMTTLGGIGHTLPYLVPNSWGLTLGGTHFDAFQIATAIAGVVVFIELWAIAYIRSRFMDTPFLNAAFQVVLGGVAVFAVGILIGSA